MATLKNNTIEKLASEGRISHISIDEAYRIQQNTLQRMTNYNRILAKKAYYSHISAENTILNS